MTARQRRPALRSEPEQDTRTLKRQRRAQESATDGSSDDVVEGEATTAIDWSYLTGSNETAADGFGVVHVSSSDTDDWEDVFPNGSTVKIVYVSGSGSTDTIVVVPDDDQESASASASASGQDSASGSLDATVNPVYSLPTDEPSGSSSSSGSTSVEAASGTMSTALTYSIVFALVAVVVVVAGVFFARRYTTKRTREGANGRARTYDLSTMFHAARPRRRTSSPSILGDTTASWRQQPSTDSQTSPLRPTTILADSETLGPLRPTVSLTPLRRTDRLARATLEANRLRASTAPVVLYENAVAPY